MNKKLLISIVIALCIITALAAVSCNQWAPPYERLDKTGNTVSVKYLANGGVFAGTKDVTVLNVYNLANAKEEWNGMKSITLVTPDNKEVLGRNAFTVSRTNCILEGWYVTTVNEDGSLNVTSEKWDFSKPYTFDPNKKYSSDTPVLILSAKWVPYSIFNVFVQNEDGTFPSEPTLVKNTLNLKYPEWNVSTGKQDTKDYPSISGKTFDKAYADSALTEEITADKQGSALYNEETGEFESDTVNVYATYKKGEWFEIYNANQLRNNAKKDGYYTLKADIDFTGKLWPTPFANNEFTGAIYGDNHTIKNVTATQSSSTGTYHGLFGVIGEEAVIENLTFDNVSYTVSGINNRNGTPSYYGLIAGSISSGATVTGVTVTNAKILLNSAKGGMFDMVDEIRPSQLYENMKDGLFIINLVVGDGEHSIDASGVSYGFSDPESSFVKDKFSLSVDSDGTVVITALS